MAYWSGTVTFHTNTGICDGHQAYFGGAGSQEGWFMGRQIQSLTQYSQSWTDKMRVVGSVDDFAKVDYVSWVNTDFSDKRYYGKVVDRHWVNANCAELEVKFDPFQTYMFDSTFRGGFVEREMQENDWNGGIPSFNNTVDEGLEISEYVSNSSGLMILGGPMWLVFYACDSSGNTVTGTTVDNIYTGVAYQAFSSAGAVSSFISSYDERGKLDYILCIVQVPNAFQNSGPQTTSVPITYTWYDGYVPKNAKCFCSPFHIVRAVDPLTSNHVNWAMEYMPSPTSVEVTFQCSKGIQPAVMIRPPVNYKGKSQVALHAEDALVISNWPQCAFVGDTFANWLAQNTGAITAGLAGSAIGIASGNPLAGVAGVVSAAGSIAKISDKSVNSAEVRGRSGASSSAFTFNETMFVPGGQYFVRGDVIRQIDGYFDAFGYRTNLAKTPNLRTRPYWNYVKMANSSITCPGSESDKREIASMFNSGVTLWHVDNGVEIGDYTQDNRG